MNATTTCAKTLASAAVAVAVFLALPRVAAAHCDTLDGPVVTDARVALEKADVTGVLKWVPKEDEPKIQEAFKKTLHVRSLGTEARELADMYFFETVVRIHRAAEGAPYTGLEAAGAELSPAVREADKALQQGNVDDLVKLLTDAVAAGVRQRFAHTVEAKKQADQTVEGGRRFVGAYVEFVHYAERLFEDATSDTAHHAQASPAGVELPDTVQPRAPRAEPQHDH
jgi:hypothetical protein